MQNIMKFIDGYLKQTVYLTYPETVYQIYDNEYGCHILIEGQGAANIEDHSARQFKRAIQERLEQPLGFLKTEYTYGDDIKGLRYFNVDYITKIASLPPIVRNDEQIEVCVITTKESPGNVKIYHSAHEVAYQVRRVMKRIDQDAEICCAPESEQESE